MAAYSYYPSWYDVTTTNPPSDEEFYWGAATVPATWDAVLSIIVDGNTAYKESTGSTTLARGPPLTRLASGTSYVVILDDTGAAYGAYKVGPKTGTDPLALRLTHYRSAGTPPTDTTKRVEVRYYPDGVSRLAANVNADWNATSGDAQILNKPRHPQHRGQSSGGSDRRRADQAVGRGRGLLCCARRLRRHHGRQRHRPHHRRRGERRRHHRH